MPRLLLLAAVLAATACSAHALRLPAGDVARGRSVFVKMNCGSCHEVATEPGLPHADTSRRVMLGGRVDVLPMPEDVAAEIVRPMDDVGPNEHAVAIYVPTVRMPSYNDRITVQELADVAAFVASSYEVEPVMIHP